MHVTAANEQERAMVGGLAEEVQAVTGGAVEVAFVDQDDTGEAAADAAAGESIELFVLKHVEAKRGFVLLPRRWVVERTFGWLGRFRRLARESASINEVDFCSQISSTANQLIAFEPEKWPFRELQIEGYGTGSAKGKREDLRFYGRDGRLILCGEVKMPGTPEGASAMSHKLVADAVAIAEDPPVNYFFTWNVNEFALWDRSRYMLPLLERRVKLWRLPRPCAKRQDVARDDNLNAIKKTFLPGLLRELADIISGPKDRDWGLPQDDVFLTTLESHLEWPVQLIVDDVLTRCETSKAFNASVQAWMSAQDWTVQRTPHDVWAKLVETIAKTLSYVSVSRAGLTR